MTEFPTTLDKIKCTAAEVLTVHQKSVESGEDVAPSALVFMADNSVGLGELNFAHKTQAWVHRPACPWSQGSSRW